MLRFSRHLPIFLLELALAGGGVEVLWVTGEAALQCMCSAPWAGLLPVIHPAALPDSAGACEWLRGFCSHVGISCWWLQSAIAFGFKVFIVQQPSFSSFRMIHLVDSWERRRLELWDVLNILLKFGEPTDYYQTIWSVPSASPELVPPSCAVLHMCLWVIRRTSLSGSPGYA